MAADGGKTTRSRWLCIARCAVAVVVTALAAVVIVRAVVVMLRPVEDLELKVAGGYVSVDRIQSMPPPYVTFSLTLRAFNPSGRAVVNYTDVTVSLIAGDGSSAAANITVFPLPDPITMLQKTWHEAVVKVDLTPGQDVPLRYVQALFDGGSIAAVLEAKGLLISHIVMEGVRQRIPTTYYCSPVSIAVGGAASSASDDSTDTTCSGKNS